MCGIVAFYAYNIFNTNYASILVNGLKKLEYRGYDACGILLNHNGEMYVEKTIGQVANLEQKIGTQGQKFLDDTLLPRFTSPQSEVSRPYKPMITIQDLQTTITYPTSKTPEFQANNHFSSPNYLLGLAHTRWASHGGVTLENTHPVQNSGIFVVHNGIIDNYQEIRNKMLGLGYIFGGETDSEVICALLHHNWANTAFRDFKIALLQSLQQLTGSFSFVVSNSAIPSQLYAVQRGSPLIIGLGTPNAEAQLDKNLPCAELFIVSDLVALPDNIRKISYIAENSLLILDKNDCFHINCANYLPMHNDATLVAAVSATDLAASKVEHYRNLIQNIDFIDFLPPVSSYKLEDFQNFTQKEIHEQPGLLHQVLQQFRSSFLSTCDDLKYKHNSKLNSSYDISNIAFFPNYRRNVHTNGHFNNLELQLKQFSALYIIACGSSFYAGSIAKYWLEELAKIPVYVEIASEFATRTPHIPDNALYIFISQSGETADTIAALHKILDYRTKSQIIDREAIDGKAEINNANKTSSHNNLPRVIALINRENSQIARLVDSYIVTDVGQEVAVASTKSFSMQLLNLLLMAICTCEELDIIDDTATLSDDPSSRGGRNDHINSQRSKINLNLDSSEKHLNHYKLSLLQSLEAEMYEFLKSEQIETLEAQIHKIIAKLKHCDISKVLFVGKGPSYPLALEAALKFKELAYIQSEGIAAGELKHGPIALLDAQTLVIVVAPNDSHRVKLQANIAEIKARKAQILLISDSEFLAKMENLIDFGLTVHECSTWLAAIIYAWPLQLFACHYAHSMGHNVDRPRNLAKSITVQ